MAVDRLTAFRRQYRSRGGGRSAGGIIYGIYVGLLAVLIYAGPAIRTLAGQFHREDLLAALVSPTLVRWLGVALGAVVTAAFALGTVRGPAVTRPFLVYALATSDIERRRAFGRTVLGGAAVVVSVTLLLSVVLLVPLADAGALTVGALFLALGASLAYGVLVTVAWLAGQVAHGVAAWLVPLLLAAATAAGALLPAPGIMPWTWAAATWPTADHGGPPLALPLGLLAAVTLAAAALAPLMVDRLRGPELIQQARRWESATVSAITGDLSAAIAGMRSVPVVGRSWRLVRGRSFLAATVIADLVAPLRTPMRLVGAVASLGVGGWLLAVAPDLPGLLPWVVGPAAAVPLYLGLGPWSDGLAHAAVALSSPRLFGVSDGRLVLAHAIAPLLGGVVVAGATAALAVPPERPWWSAPAVATCLIATLVVVRLAAAAKTVPPLFLSTPMVTPMGDMSVFGLLAWQLDAVIWSLLAGLAALGLWSGTPLAVIGLLAIAGVSLLQWRGRLRKR